MWGLFWLLVHGWRRAQPTVGHVISRQVALRFTLKLANYKLACLPAGKQPFPRVLHHLISELLSWKQCCMEEKTGGLEGPAGEEVASLSDGLWWRTVSWEKPCLPLWCRLRKENKTNSRKMCQGLTNSEKGKGRYNYIEKITEQQKWCKFTYISHK